MMCLFGVVIKTAGINSYADLSVSNLFLPHYFKSVAWRRAKQVLRRVRVPVAAAVVNNIGLLTEPGTALVVPVSVSSVNNLSSDRSVLILT